LSCEKEFFRRSTLVAADLEKLGGHLISTPDFTPGAEEQEHKGSNGNTCRFGDGDAEGEDEGCIEEGTRVVEGDGG
jgi:hypothetical protein